MSEFGAPSSSGRGRHRAASGRHRAGGGARASRTARQRGRHRAPALAPTTVPTVLALATGLAVAAAASAEPAVAAPRRPTPPTPTPAPSTVRPTLHIGDSGAAVRLLQGVLSVPVDGVFGPKTQAAVVALQRRYRLVADGVVGPRTWTAVLADMRRHQAPAPPPTRNRPAPSLHSVLKPGDQGAEVAALQGRLGIRPADGMFGPRTLALVTDFQRAHGLTPDGVVGPRTWAVLDKPVVQPPPVRTCVAVPPYHFVDSFGAPRSGGRKHQGIDVMADRNAPVLAIESGVVVRSYVNRLGGNAIILRGTTTRDEYYYAHQTRNLVRSGQTVTRGQQIGLVGNTGDAAGGPTHIHFEWWLDGGPPINPYPLLKRLCTG